MHEEDRDGRRGRAGGSSRKSVTCDVLVLAWGVPHFHRGFVFRHNAEFGSVRWGHPESDKERKVHGAWCVTLVGSGWKRERHRTRREGRWISGFSQGSQAQYPAHQSD